MLPEINGYTVADGKPVPGFTALKDDGSTACGCWIYSGCYADGVNQTARRKPQARAALGGAGVGLGVARQPAHPLQPRLGRSRRASPGRSARGTSGGTRTSGKWTGYDVPDFIEDRPPDYRPPQDAQGHRHASAAIDPFIMQADGKGWLFAPSRAPRRPAAHALRAAGVGRSQNPLYGQQCNPARMEWHRRDNPYHARLGRPALPVRAHHLPAHRAPHRRRHEPLAVLAVASCSRRCSARSRPSWPRERGLTNGGWATITHRPRRDRVPGAGHATASARCGWTGRTIHTDRPALSLGLRGPRHAAIAANELISFVADPNVSIQESKALTGDIEPGPARHAARAAAAPRAGRGAAQARAATVHAPRRPARPARGAPSRPPDRAAGGRSPDGRQRRASSPTRPSASAARPARSPASSGTSSPTTASSSPGMSLRQHRAPGRLHLAARGLRRAPRPAAGAADGGGRLLLADDVRRLQALRARRLPGGLPHRRHRPHRVRLGLRAAGRLQRLRLLRRRPARSA